MQRGVAATVGDDCEVIVVGLGAMGSCALWSLARRGVNAIGLDQYDPPHDQGSSHGETRIIRSAMLEGRQYAPLIRRAFELWSELGWEASRDLFVRTGILFISRDGPTEMASMAARSLSDVGLPYEGLGPRELARRYPQHRGAANLVATFDPSGGFVRAEDTILAALGRAEERGATVLRWTRALAITSDPRGGVVVETDKGPVRARRAIVSVGPWLPTFLSGRAVPVTLERQIFAYFELDGLAGFTPEEFPPFIRDDLLVTSSGVGAHAWLSHGLSGFPSLDGRRIKLLLLEAGRPTTLDTLDRRVPDALLEELKVTEVDPRLIGVGRPAAGTGKACLYTNAPDRDFIIGELPGQPNVTLVSACSGHGFKFAPAIGELGADLATATRPRVPVEPFAPSRAVSYQPSAVSPHGG